MKVPTSTKVKHSLIRSHETLKEPQRRLLKTKRSLVTHTKVYRRKKMRKKEKKMVSFICVYRHSLCSLRTLLSFVADSSASSFLCICVTKDFDD